MSASNPEEALKNVLSILMGEDGSNFRVRLYRTNIVITQATTLLHFFEANYDGYAEYQSALWSAPAIDVNGDGFTMSPAIVFQKSAGIIENTIYGAYLVHDDGVHSPRLLQVEKFTTPVLMSVTTDQIPLRWLYSDRNIVA